MNFIKNKGGDAANAAKNAVQAARSNNNINGTGSALQQIRNTIDNLSAANGSGGLRMEGDKIFYFSVDEESMPSFIRSRQSHLETNVSELAHDVGTQFILLLAVVSLDPK